MLSKSEISLLKNSKNGEIRDLIYKNIRNNSFILNILKNLGKLSDGFDGEWLLQLSESKCILKFAKFLKAIDRN